MFSIARAAKEGGADGVTAINTVSGTECSKIFRKSVLRLQFTKIRRTIIYQTMYSIGLMGLMSVNKELKNGKFYQD